VETVIDYFSRVAQYNWLVVTIELFLIGLVVYWVVDFLEGTRGERLFRGVIFILIAGVLILNLVVEQFGFERLQYLYKGFLIAVLIIAVAAFQPEIRRVLIRIGQPRFLAVFSQQLVRTVEEIITAVTELSAAKIGAIIVIEKRVALGEFIETGVRMDARVTAALLKTVFHPGTALLYGCYSSRRQSSCGQGAVAFGRSRQCGRYRTRLPTPRCYRYNRRFGCLCYSGERGNRHNFTCRKRKVDSKNNRISTEKTPHQHSG